MPCNSDYMNPSFFEINASRVLCLLGELEGKKWTDSEWRGYHKLVYNKNFQGLDHITQCLCSKLQAVDVTKYSLEMQMWWREHQKADKARLEKELKNNKIKQDKQKALSKLTKYERKLLGY